MYVCMYIHFYIQVHLCGCGDPFRWDSTCSFRDSRIYKVRGSVIFTCMEYANVHLRACGDPLAGTASVEFVTPPYTELPTVSYINILNMRVHLRGYIKTRLLGLRLKSSWLLRIQSSWIIHIQTSWLFHIQISRLFHIESWCLCQWHHCCCTWLWEYIHIYTYICGYTLYIHTCICIYI